MTLPPRHPSALAEIPMRYSAEIRLHDGWWFRYLVNRRHGIWIPERGTSLHRTLRGARRAARKWVGSNTRSAPVVIERYGERTANF